MQIVLYGSIGWRHPFGFGQVIDWAKQFGWDAVDARGMSIDIAGDVQHRLNAFGYDMLGPRQIRGSARRDLRKKLEDNGLKLLGIYCSSPVNLAGNLGQSCRELFLDYLQLGADLGVEWIRSINNTTSDRQGGTMTAEEAFDRTVEGTRLVGGRARELGIKLLLENNENTVTSDAGSLLRLQQATNDVCPVGIAYDPVNAYFQGLDVEEGLVKLKGKIDILHLKNVRRSEEQRWDYMPRGNNSYEWKPLAEGDLDWVKLLQLAARDGFSGPLVYEYVNPFKGMPLKYWDTLPEPEDAAKREADYLRSVLSDI